MGDSGHHIGFSAWNWRANLDGKWTWENTRKRHQRVSKIHWKRNASITWTFDILFSLRKFWKDSLSSSTPLANISILAGAPRSTRQLHTGKGRRVNKNIVNTGLHSIAESATRYNVKNEYIPQYTSTHHGSANGGRMGSSRGQPLLWRW